MMRFQVRRTLVDIGLGTEWVETKWRALDAVGKLNGLVNVVDCQNGDEWTETLLGAERVLNGVNLDNGRSNEEVILVHFATNQNLALAVVKHGLEASEVVHVDNARVIRRFLGALGVELLVSLLELLNDSWYDALIDEEVVLRRADLASVDVLAPEHTAGDQTRIGSVANNGRVDTTELKNDRRQVRSGGLGDDATDTSTTSEEDLVPALSQESLRLSDTTLDDSVARGVERRLNNLLHNVGTSGGVL